ncbi:hypothetical protein Lalb_Chr03g0039931 [Lupinus albus]|uniref:Uncharacterized protein n=1 Tax=Lupinus albus TaxID=3870 RepID=A0A6A4QW39_LUPAL|nr:hypothetical protein Lalb_Chr03g0039931 [Lupinus albus]
MLDCGKDFSKFGGDEISKKGEISCAIMQVQLQALQRKMEEMRLEYDRRLEYHSHGH